MTTKSQQPGAALCVCGHSRKEHETEPPYGCEALIEGIDCEDDDYCECRSFTFLELRKA